jgi:leucyl-tRNA synthetase
MFASPPEQTLEWSDEGVEGAYRFIKRLWRAVYGHAGTRGVGEPGAEPDERAQRDMRRRLHETIAKVGDDIGRRYTFNTAIAAIMELLNDLARFEDESESGRAVRQEVLLSIVTMLSPIVPHVTQALWEALGQPGLVVDARWPAVDESALVREDVELVVQVKGKLRGRIRVPVDAAEDAIRSAALAEPNVQRFVGEHPVRKVIIVPGRLVNIVV